MIIPADLKEKLLVSRQQKMRVLKKNMGTRVQLLKKFLSYEASSKYRAPKGVESPDKGTILEKRLCVHFWGEFVGMGWSP